MVSSKITKPVPFIYLHYPQYLTYFMINLFYEPVILLWEDPEN